MPRRGFIWRHVTISTLNSWLHGDARGFRSRRHRLHSSGDYKRRPPEGEHAGLFKYMKSKSGDPIVIPSALRGIVGSALIDALIELDVSVLVASVSGCHAHFLAELPRDPVETRRLVGIVKSRASRAVRDQLPGRLWSEGGSYEPVETRKHHRNTFDYILDHAEEGAWVWSFQERESKHR